MLIDVLLEETSGPVVELEFLSQANLIVFCRSFCWISIILKREAVKQIIKVIERQYIMFSELCTE